MGDTYSFRRLRWGPPRPLSTPRFPHKRRFRLGGFWIAALVALIGGFLQYRFELLPANFGDHALRSVETIRDVTGRAIAVPDRFEPPRPRGHAGPSVTVIDGDTVRSKGETYRLVGIDTPETRPRAKCDSEHERALRARERLRELIDDGDTSLTRAPCACPRGTEGTSACNHGRLCGRLAVRGRDVGGILVGEGLARRYDCNATSCPPRRSWCG
jgi:endonuclease YncB( thermonuclease family)